MGYNMNNFQIIKGICSALAFWAFMMHLPSKFRIRLSVCFLANFTTSAIVSPCC